MPFLWFPYAFHIYITIQQQRLQKLRDLIVYHVLPLQMCTGRGKLCQIGYYIQYQEKWANFHLDNVMPKGHFHRIGRKEITQ